MGKTAMALELARKTAELGRGVAFFSLEMGNQQLATRYLSSETGLSNTQLRTGRVGNYNELVQRANNIAALPIYVDDTSAISLFQLRSKLRRLRAKQPIDLVFIDYLQLMKAEAKSREQEVSQVSRGLKEIAKEMQVPIIALSQLNREVETRGNRWPRLSDLRESGAIEQDADMVIFLYRPAYYKEETIQFDGKQLNTEGLLLFDIAKHRNGALGTIPLKHNASITRIVSNDEQFDITPF